MVGPAEILGGTPRSKRYTGGNMEKYNNNVPSLEKSEDVEGNKFKREIGLFNAVAITVGAIIGSGIFISPKGIVSHVGSVGASLGLWVFCGLISVLGAFCYAELGTMYPSAGGEYTYILEAFGPMFAFLVLWSNTLLLVPMGYAVVGLAFANYITQPFFQTANDIPDSAIRLLAAVVICFVTFLNCCDLKKTKKMLNVFMVIKISALILVIFGGVYSFLQGNTKGFDDIWADSKVTPGSLVLASFSGSYAFNGWNAMTLMMEELKEPNKNLPRAICISLFLVTCIYLLTNASYFAVLSPAEIISSDAVAVTFIEKIIGFWGWIVPIFVSVSIFGSLCIYILTTSRSCFVGSRCGQLPSFISLMKLSNKTPAAASIFLCTLSLMFLLTSDVYVLIEFGGIAGAFISVLTILSLISLRWTKPNVERPFKVPFVIPLLYLLITLGIFVIPIFEKPITSGIGAIMTLSGIPIYYILVKQDQVKLTPKWILNVNEKLTLCVQKLLVAVKEDS